MVIESDNGIFLRTVLRKDVHTRLTEFAQQYRTGGDKWDYGVAIQLLLDFFESNSSVTQVNMKLDFLLQEIQGSHQQPEQEEPKKKTISLLGGGEINDE
jgi:hypothetical protein